MKRFQFRLQKILDLGAKREEALKERLFELDLKVVQAQQALLSKETELSGLCADQARQRVRGRCENEDLFAGYCGHLEKQILLNRDGLSRIEKVRDEVVQVLQDTANFRRSLEKLREGALETHMTEFLREEQKLLDEHSSSKFVRTRGRSIGE